MVFFNYISRLLRKATNQAPDDLDLDFSRATHPDVALEDPATHWKRMWRRQGARARLPEQLPPFDPDYYHSRYRDAARSPEDPFRHWLSVGVPEGRTGTWPVGGSKAFSSLRAAIETFGLFDRSFYLANYAEDIPGTIDPLDHYIRIGQHQGLKPNESFDPLLYVLHHPDAREAGPLLHYLDRLCTEEIPHGALSTTTTFPDVQHPAVMLNKDSQPQELQERDRQQNVAQSERFGAEEVLEFTIDESAYRLVAPSAADFFDRIRDDKPFALSRLPHGFWDCLLELDKARAQVAQTVEALTPQIAFSQDEISRLAERACHAVMPDMAVFEENFLRELLGEIQHDEASADHMRSVSFKWQPSVDGRVFGRTEEIGSLEEAQLRTFARYFPPDAPVFEAMVWKRWVFSGDIMRLAVEARDRPVVLVGANRVGELGQRLQLPWFSHLEIPLSSYQFRYNILEQCKQAVLEAKATAERYNTKRPLIMLQGGSFAYWLIARLHKWDPSVFYMDFGQAIHVWFLDNRDLWLPWLMFHPRLVMENCGLDDFYASLGIDLDPPFGRQS